MDVLCITEKHMMVRLLDYHFIAITPWFTLTRSGNIWLDPVYGLTELFIRKQTND